MSLDIPRIQALCFDVDGTLRDTDDHYAQRFERLFRVFKWALPGNDPKNAARRFVMTVETPANLIFSIPDRLGFDAALASMKNWIYEKKILQEPQKHYMLVPGSAETLAKLSTRYPMAVVTARGQRETTAFLESCGLSQYFQVIVSAQTAHRTKPHPAPVRWAAEHMKVLPENCLMIGDTTVDIHAGLRAGAQTVGVLSGFGEQKELIKVGADTILPSVAALLELLSQN